MSGPAVPDIPSDADEDLPPDSAVALPGELQAVEKAKQGSHDRFMDKAKHYFAYVLVGASFLGIVVFSVLEHYVPGIQGQSFDGTIDTLKLLATTGIGFVFGRAVMPPKK